MTPSRPATRPGFTLVELMIVITVILILASMILVIRPANPEGLANGQRMLASMIRSAKSQALMNRGALPRPAGSTIAWAPAEFRYRVLIKNDPADPDRHLREMVIAIGFIGVGATPALQERYVWFSPDPPVLLPPGIFFVPPNGAPSGFTNPTVVLPAATAVDASGGAANARRSNITPIPDTWKFLGSNEQPGAGTVAPRMRYRPIASPMISPTAPAFFEPVSGTSLHAATSGGREWFYIELGPDGSLAHSGRVMLVVAEGVIVPVGTSSSVRFEKPDRFAAILVRRNGEVALTVDALDFQSNALK